MASIPVHQDVYNFERTYKGLTRRQIATFAFGGVIAALMTGLLGYAIGIPYIIAGTAGLLVAAPVVFAGFAPIKGMPADELVQRMGDMNERGAAFGWEGLHVPEMKGTTSSEYKKSTRKKGAECL